MTANELYVGGAEDAGKRLILHVPGPIAQEELKTYFEKESRTGGPVGLGRSELNELTSSSWTVWKLVAGNDQATPSCRSNGSTPATPSRRRPALLLPVEEERRNRKRCDG